MFYTEKPRKRRRKLPPNSSLIEVYAYAREWASWVIPHLQQIQDGGRRPH